MVVTLAPSACTASIVHDAAAALGGVAADMRSSETQMIAQELHQQRSRLDLARFLLAVNDQRHARHFCSPCSDRSVLACWIACQMASGVAGIVISRIPKPLSASTIPLMTQAGAPAVAPSLPDLMPSGLVGDSTSTISQVSGGNVVDDGMPYSSNDGVSGSPERGSRRICSNSASPTPWAIEPCVWPSTVIGLMQRPTSSTET